MNEFEQQSSEQLRHSADLEQIVADLPDIFAQYTESLWGDQAAQSAVERAEARLSETHMAMHDLLGIQAADINLETMERIPTKHGHSNLSDQHRVAESLDGQPVFIKDVPAMGASKVGNLYMITKTQGEVFASRLAAVMNYPMPKTKLSHIEGTVVLVSDYHAGSEHSPHNGLHYEGPIANPEALAARPIFDALLGLAMSTNDEGIVDNESKEYFAVDASLRTIGKDLEITPDEMHRRIIELNNGNDLEMSNTIEQYVHSLKAALTDGSLSSIFNDAIAPDSLKQHYARELEARARAFVQLFEQPSL